MWKPRPIPEDPGIRLLRLTLGGLMAIHGLARIRLGLVDDFGVVLGQWGFPLAAWLAWSITTWELLGAALLAARRFVVPACALFALQLATGIALVHFPEGWFVVGAGRNGMEYSVALISGFIAVAWSHRRGGRIDGLEGESRTDA